MITMDQNAEIRSCSTQGESLRGIARSMGLHRNIVRCRCPTTSSPDSAAL